MRIRIDDDFDLEKIRDSGQCFRVEPFEDGTYRFISSNQYLYIRRSSPGYYQVKCRRGAWDKFWRVYFDLDRNYHIIRSHIPASDPFLQAAAQAGRGIRILRQDPWEMLITFIISQRKNIPAIRKAVNQLARKYGKPIDTGREVIYSFPTARDLARAGHNGLAGCSLGYRLPYIECAIDMVRSGKLDLTRLEGLPLDEIKEALKTVQGVGDKVAGCIALFGYGRTDAAPVDVWISRVIKENYGGIDPFTAYGQEAGIMQQYAFYYIQHVLRQA